ncbi:ECF transporter S component [Anaerophilus nitritogenes]|uniref:ECF transporter S component n=1 Tax=Anaerophilus nitritogenes TaxID=2498136 RepID=UPI001FA95E62|nr:ECF transporter S component [Anaerophilus nitritogenes]
MNRTSAVQKGFFGFEEMKTARGLVKISILSVLAYLIMFFEMPILFFPGFLKIDASDLPALLGSFALGPAAGIMIQLLKNLLHLMNTTTGGVGELANFLIGIAMIIPAGIVYRKNKTKMGAMIGLILGTICMSIIGGVTNYYILLPFYGKVMPLDQIIAFSASANGAIKDVDTLVFYGIIPFNIVKGMLLSILTISLYKKLSPILKER